MNILFIQGGSRLKKDKGNNWYTDGTFNDNVWKRYKSYGDNLTVILRKEDKIYEIGEAKEKYNYLDRNNINLVPVIDINKPISRFFSLSNRKSVAKIIEEEVKKADKVIIRSIHNFYTLTALKFCKKYDKDYLVEVAGYAYDGYWYHGDIYGKIVAIPYEILAKYHMRNVPYAVYVTNRSLQNRYPTKGKSIGCSDVEIYNTDKNDLENRIKKLEKKINEKIVLGTIGWVNLKTKGQQDVIKALALLKKAGVTNFEYQLVGAGNDSYLRKLAEKLSVEEMVKFCGGKPHEEVFDWLNDIDVYIQPSYQEGLCRAVVEAMSKACPIIVSNAGGNPELANNDFVFKKGDYKKIAKILTSLDNKKLINEAKRSFELSKSYRKDLLDKKRNEFYNEFVKNI